jgi:hypothetical protein
VISVAYSGDTNFSPSTSANFTQVINQAGTTTTLATTQANAGYGAATITATVAPVAPGAGTPTGSVTFAINNGSTTSNVTVNLVNGVATLSPALTVGTYTLTATYSGDTDFSASGSNAISQTVTPGTTTTTLTSNMSVSAQGQPVTFTATVAGSGVGVIVPTGTVTFTIDGAPQTPVSLDATGKATLTISNLSLGQHAIGATYTGDANFLGSSASSLTQTVKPASSTALTASANPAVAGQSVTFTATVKGGTAGTPTGTVVFTVDGTAQPAVSLSGGIATLTLNNLTTGSHQILAAYSGDINYAPSTSNSLTEVVNKANVGVSLASSGNSVFGQAVTFTATITPVAPGAGTPTGTVIFSIDGTAQPAATVSGGLATLTVSTLAPGAHTITAAYSGDSSFNAGNATPLAQTVSLATATATLTSSSNPSVFGQSVTFTATVVAGGQSTGTPTGTVIFSVDGVPQPAVTLSGGTATLTLSNLSTSQHTITVTYNGDANFNSASSTPLSQTVNHAGTTTMIATSGSTTFGQAATFTATVTAAAPGSGTPTGTVTFLVDSQFLATVPLNANGQAQITTTSLGMGAHTITAVYNGDSNFVGSTAATAQVVNPQAIVVTPTPTPTSTTPGTTTSPFSAVTTPTVFSLAVVFANASKFNGVATLKVASGPGTLSGKVVMKVSHGHVTFTNLTLSKPGTYVLVASAKGLTPVKFTVVVTATGLDIIVPSSIKAGIPFDMDIFTNSRSNGSKATVSIVKGPRGGRLHGHVTGTVSGNKVVLSRLTFNGGGKYTLKVTVGVLTQLITVNVSGKAPTPVTVVSRTIGRRLA